MINRRGVLRAGTVGALGTGMVGLLSPPAAAAPPAEAVERVSRRDWARLADALSPRSTLYLPVDSGYPPLALPFNHRYAGIRPAGIVACATTGDAREAIRWARSVGLPAVPRSGLGHNYAGYSATTGLLLNMARMKRIVSAPLPGARSRTRSYGPIKVTHGAGTVTVGAGVTNADLHPLLEDLGRFVPTGRCPTVGVAGLVLGGGIGFSDKMFGLTCDRLVSTTVVLADGRVVEASQDAHPDLFWGCRGGAGNNFGVHTSFTFQYEQFQGNVGFYQLRWSLDSVLPVLATAQRIAVNTLHDKRFHLRVGIGTHGTTRDQIHANANVNAIGQYYGPLDGLLAILAPLLAIGTAEERAGNSASVREVTPGQASVLLSATTPVEKFAAKSAVLHSRTLLTDEQVGAAAERLLDWPGSDNPDGAGFAMFALGGEINQVPSGATAFVHRNGVFILAAETSWADYDPPCVATANLHWLREFYHDIYGDTPPRDSYQNFPDPTLKDWRRAYYGANYDRLVRVKRKYDPTDFFSYPQGIGS
ncbi:FAD-dependent oxidoreductase [Micromonospora narathiwatensis]|uniref:FAD/FMN-containing dehydrogenase n=1 Tax=Micromonospora narathiwatensis TaxID=299146 RepID=A0A1A8ZB80_9ACTN|nr:FAD-dependent oxidoreductase [Micromonospora narathiwatensis]SBT41229.1 FAD/FMN-containing dehydrogenase [Micromonospora narathiwatensis]